MPSARPVRYRNGQPIAHDPDSWPRLAEILRLNPEERRTFEARIHAACASDDDKSPCWHTPILVREDVSRDIVAELKQHHDELAGVDVVGVPVRFYPYKNLGAHMLGYVAEIDAETLAQVPPAGLRGARARRAAARQPARLRGGRHRRRDGHRARVGELPARAARLGEARGRRARSLPHRGPRPSAWSTRPPRMEPIPGRDLRLSVDVELEQAIERAMRPHAAGAAVVVDVRTGRLLALYSKPDFDPNDLSGGAGQGARARGVQPALRRPAAPDARQDDERRVPARVDDEAVQRARRARGPRRSTPSTPRSATGYVIFGRRIFRCSHVHGKVRLHEAIARSCNVYFFHLAETVGMDRIARVAQAFGLGREDRASASTRRPRAASRRARGTRSATAGSSASASRSTWRSARAT